MTPGKRRLNCWEAMACGREPGGANVEKKGVCPATTEKQLDGINQGLCGGRSCWAVEGTDCAKLVGGRNGAFDRCLRCPFFRRVEREEGRDFVAVMDMRQDDS